jgi:hypothetical protein
MMGFMSCPFVYEVITLMDGGVVQWDGPFVCLGVVNEASFFALHDSFFSNICSLSGKLSSCKTYIINKTDLSDIWCSLWYNRVQIYLLCHHVLHCISNC